MCCRFKDFLWSFFWCRKQAATVFFHPKFFFLLLYFREKKIISEPEHHQEKKGRWQKTSIKSLTFLLILWDFMRWIFEDFWCLEIGERQSRERSTTGFEWASKIEIIRRSDGEMRKSEVSCGTCWAFFVLIRDNLHFDCVHKRNHGRWSTSFH